MRWALVVALLGLFGCDPAAARWVADAASIHAQADALVRASDTARARALLEELVHRPVPLAVAAQDRRAVLQDTYARLAFLALGSGDPRQALRDTDAGLALGESSDLFAATLHTMRGRAREALGQDADAARDYEAAQVVAEALLEQLLSDGGSP